MAKASFEPETYSRSRSRVLRSAVAPHWRGHLMRELVIVLLSFSRVLLLSRSYDIIGDIVDNFSHFPAVVLASDALIVFPARDYKSWRKSKKCSINVQMSSSLWNRILKGISAFLGNIQTIRMNVCRVCVFYITWIKRDRKSDTKANFFRNYLSIFSNTINYNLWINFPMMFLIIFSLRK